MNFRWLRGDRGHLSHEELSTYVDGGPGALSDAAANAHLAKCDGACAAELEALRTTVAILRSVEPVVAPRSFALTPEMVADLPDGRPLGSPPPMRGAGMRMPVWAPAIGAAAAAVVFALVLVGNLTGSIGQSGSSANETVAGATSGDAASAPAAADASLEMQAEAALAPPTALGAEGDANLKAAAGITAMEPEVAAGSALVEPTAPGQAGPDEPVESFAAPAAVPQPELAGETQAGGAEVTAEEAFKLETVPEDTVSQRSVGEARQTTPVQIGESTDEGFTLPVWQVLLGTGLATLALGVVAAVSARRRQLF